MTREEVLVLYTKYTEGLSEKEFLTKYPEAMSFEEFVEYLLEA